MASSTDWSSTVSATDDGAVLLEWTKEKSRFGISFEKNESNSGWFVVSLGPKVMAECSYLSNIGEMAKYLKELLT